MEPLTLVIIEDEEAHFSLMKRAIIKELPNAAVYHFQDSQTCLNSLDEIMPTVIITDYLMPGLNGLEFLEVLNQQHKDIPVIMVTGQGDENIAVRAIKLGAQDYLVKSGHFFTLLPSVIEKVVREKKIRDSLLESEKKYGMVVNYATVSIVVTQDGFLKLVNPHAVKTAGYSETELTTRPFVEFVHPEDRDILSEYHVRRLKGEKIPETYLFRIISKDGKIKWIENKGVLIIWKGRPATLNFLSDITERKLMEETLRESESHKKAILDAYIDRIRYVDADMKIIWANQTFTRELGISPEEIIGRFCYQLSRERNTPCEECPTLKARATRRLERAVTYYPGKGEAGTERYWDSYSVPIIDEQNEITGFIQIARDITEQKKAEDLIRNLSQTLIQAQEHERRMISYELHDRIAQDLSVLKIGCDTLFDNQPAVSDEIRQKVSGFSKTFGKVIGSVRDLSYLLRPPGLDQLGLVQSIVQYCEDFHEKTGLSVDFTSAGMDVLQLDNSTNINLYRLVQEGLNNIRKHADTMHATIKLVSAYPNINLTIIDEGKGFDVKKRIATMNHKKRMGLQSMKERAMLLGGEMVIQSYPGKGTKIVVKVPIKNK